MINEVHRCGSPRSHAPRSRVLSNGQRPNAVGTRARCGVVSHAAVLYSHRWYCYCINKSSLMSSICPASLMLAPSRGYRVTDGLGRAVARPGKGSRKRRGRG